MDITQETAEHVAKLARLAVTPEDALKYAEEMSKILTYMDQLNTVDLSKIDVSLKAENLAATNFREDEGVREFSREELLKNAPNEENGFFQVPQILGS